MLGAANVVVHGPSNTAGTALGGAPKRVVDLAIALIALVLLSPVMLIVAVLVWLTTGGPVFFSHRRIGYAGRSFRCYKFRTMVRNGEAVLANHFVRVPEAAREWQEVRKLRRDPRITPLGALLRASSIDELPQLLNVLRGEMSCVGPRPIVEEELNRYGSHAAEYFMARPGVTGLWQVSGRSRRSYADRVQLDVHYVRKWSLWGDVVILVRTVGAVVRTDESA